MTKLAVLKTKIGNNEINSVNTRDLHNGLGITKDYSDCFQKLVKLE